MTQPASSSETLIRWHRKGFRLFWRWKSGAPGRPAIPANVQRLIATMARANRTWGEERIANELYTRNLPELDLLVRTSGELRISNFLLWQSAYSEIYVTETLWPDFRRVHLLEAVVDYQRRDRRFGGLKLVVSKQ